MLNNNKLTIYPSLDTTPHKISERSVFYPLEPIGIGTPYCESLVSYITRLADEHCVSSKKLLEQVNGKKSQFISLMVKSDENELSNIISNLERLTKQCHLKCLTMLCWSRLINFSGLYKSAFSWCPICYEEWNQQKKIFYWPIIWLINLVSVCPIHNYPLRQNCFECGFLLKNQFTVSKIGYCPHCGGWLGYTHKGEKTENKDDLSLYPLTQQYIIKNLSDLIALNSSVEYDVSRERIGYLLSSSAFLLRYKRFYGSLKINTNSFKDLLKIVNTDLDELSKPYLFEHIYSFKVLLKKTYSYKISLRDFFFKDVDILMEEIMTNLKIFSD